ncbi:hypothetical protein HKX48_009477 [Thoreauomyces humboldtii]|nr:hypothetical protein HKX48_009477 [Thoreauomyces humboldtii]
MPPPAHRDLARVRAGAVHKRPIAKVRKISPTNVDDELSSLIRSCLIDRPASPFNLSNLDAEEDEVDEELMQHTSAADNAERGTLCDWLPSEDLTNQSDSFWHNRTLSTYHHLLNVYGVAHFPHWGIQLHTYDAIFGRWTRTGRCLLYVHPRDQGVLVAHNVFGSQSVALNMRVPEFFDRVCLSDEQASTITFSTIQHNNILAGSEKGEIVTIGDIYPELFPATTKQMNMDVKMNDLEHAEEPLKKLDKNIALMQAEVYHHDLKLVKDESVKTLRIQFRASDEHPDSFSALSTFQAAARTATDHTYKRNTHNRLQSFALPQTIKLQSIYSGVTEPAAAAYADMGLAWAPSVNALTAVQCAYCGSTMMESGEVSMDELRDAHAVLARAKGLMCPFVNRTEGRVGSGGMVAGW